MLWVSSAIFSAWRAFSATALIDLDICSMELKVLRVAFASAIACPAKKRIASSLCFKEEPTWLVDCLVSMAISFKLSIMALNKSATVLSSNESKLALTVKSPSVASEISSMRV